MKQKTKWLLGAPLMLLLCMVLMLAFAACTDPEDPDDPDDPDATTTETFTWTGLEDISITMGDVTDPLMGITVTDNVLGKDVTDQVVVLNTDDNEEELTALGVWDEFEDFSYNMAGTYTVYYQITSSGVTETKKREITVVAAHNLGNGDFTIALNAGGYYKWTFDQPGGTATLSQDSETGKPLFTISNVGNGWWSLQYYNSVNLTSGETYKITITAKSDTGKSVAFGFEDVNNNYAMLQNLTVHQLTSDMTSYVSYYTADASYQNAKAVLYLGYMLDEDLDVSEHTVLIDSINIEVVETCPNVTFSGLDTITVDSAEALAALDITTGVTASYGDQDVTSKITIIGELPTGVLETTTYALVYYIENVNGLDAYAIRNVKFEVFKTNDYDLANGDFSLGDSYWTQDVNQTEGSGEATFEKYEDDDATGVAVTIITPSSAGWHIMLRQDTTLTANTNYIFTVVAKASIARSIVLEIGGVTQYTMDLTTEYQTFEFSYTAKSSGSYRVAFLMGGGGTDNKNSVIYLDDITITLDEDQSQYEAYELADPNFENGLKSWSTEGDTATFTGYDGYVTVANNDDSSYMYSVQLRQDGLEFEAGVTYTIIIKAKVDSGTRTIAVEAYDYGVDSSDRVVDLYSTFTLTTDLQIFTITFTPSADVSGVRVGALLGGTGVKGTTVTFTEFSITSSEEYNPVNGDFSEGDSDWTRDISYGEATFEKYEDGDVIGVAVTIVTASTDGWHIMLRQDIDVKAGTIYVFTIVAKASSAQSVVLEVNGSSNQYTMNLTTEYQTFTYTYTSRTTESIRVAFLMGSCSTGAVIYLDDITVSLDENQEIFEEYAMLNSDFANGLERWGTEGDTATFAGGDGYVTVTLNSDSDAGWRVQLRQDGLILSEGVTYTITIVAKVEGITSRTVTVEVPLANYAQDITLTNEYQTFTLTFTASSDLTGVRVGCLLGGTGVAGGTVTFTEFSLSISDSE